MLLVRSLSAVQVSSSLQAALALSGLHLPAVGS